MKIKFLEAEILDGQIVSIGEQLFNIAKKEDGEEAFGVTVAGVIITGEEDLEPETLGFEFILNEVPTQRSIMQFNPLQSSKKYVYSELGHVFFPSHPDITRLIGIRFMDKVSDGLKVKFIIHVLD